jgi:hypothetical protein
MEKLKNSWDFPHIPEIIEILKDQQKNQTDNGTNLRGYPFKHQLFESRFQKFLKPLPAFPI